MPVEIGLWKVGENVTRISYSSMDTEKRLEDFIAEDVSLIDSGLMLIGRQVPTSHGKFVDLLALDAAGSLVVVELKRDCTPREVVAQLLDYGSWVRSLKAEDIGPIFNRFAEKFNPKDIDVSLDQAFCRKFGVKEIPDTLNESHRLIVVASELDPSTERIINYLSGEYGVDINAIFFRCFRDGGNEYLTRAWLVDPVTTNDEPTKKGGRLSDWNGEYYVSFGGGRDWEKAKTYGYVSAGGGSFYTRTLALLDPGARVWVNIPGTGYVGVGVVTAPAVPVYEFRVKGESGAPGPLLITVEGIRNSGETDPDKVEQMVAVEWIHALRTSEAVWEKGFFGNQNTVARPRDKKWNYTIERLKKVFGVDG